MSGVVRSALNNGLNTIEMIQNHSPFFWCLWTVRTWATSRRPVLIYNNNTGLMSAPMTHTHTHTRWFLWFTGTFHRRNGFNTVQTVCAIALHLNLALTGDGAFLLSLKKTHSVWFISILNYGDTENVLINHLLLVIPVIPMSLYKFVSS